MRAEARKLRTPLIWIGVAAIYLLPFLALKGFGAAYIKFDGIYGESTSEKHKDEIDVLSWSWGVSNSGSYQVGGTRTSGYPNLQDFTFVHKYDKASPLLALRCFTGKTIPAAIFTATRTTVDGEAPYLVVTFTDVLVRSISIGGSATNNTVPSESISIGYRKLKFEYTEISVSGKGARTQVEWDLEANKGG